MKINTENPVSSPAGAFVCEDIDEILAEEPKIKELAAGFEDPVAVSTVIKSASLELLFADLSSKLQLLRLYVGASCKQVAEMMDVDEESVYEMEWGDRADAYMVRHFLSALRTLSGDDGGRKISAVDVLGPAHDQDIEDCTPTDESIEISDLCEGADIRDVGTVVEAFELRKDAGRLGRNLKMVREKAGLSPAEVAVRMGDDMQRVLLWEAGDVLAVPYDVRRYLLATQSV